MCILLYSTPTCAIIYLSERVVGGNLWSRLSFFPSFFPSFSVCVTVVVVVVVLSSVVPLEECGTPPSLSLYLLTYLPLHYLSEIHTQAEKKEDLMWCDLMVVVVVFFTFEL